MAFCLVVLAEGHQRDRPSHPKFLQNLSLNFLLNSTNNGTPTGTTSFLGLFFQPTIYVLPFPSLYYVRFHNPAMSAYHSAASHFTLWIFIYTKHKLYMLTFFVT